MADDHRSRSTRDSGHIVMLGHPIAVITQFFGVAGEINGSPKSIRCAASG